MISKKRVFNFLIFLPAPLREGGKRLVLITLGAVALGLLLILLFPRFRPSEILRSNGDFMPHIAGTIGDDGPMDAGEEMP